MADTNDYDIERHLQLLDTGKYSDFEVTCGDHTIKCHRSILCTQSEYFQKLADGNFKNNGKATFADDNPALIARMLVFLYTGRYMAKSISPQLAVTQFKSIPDPFATEKQTNQLHIAMYALGDKICNEKLCSAAKRQFYVNFFLKIWPGVELHENLADIVELVYTTTPECDRGLRDITVQNVLKCLVKENASNQDVLRKTVKQVPDFAFDLIVHPLSPRQYKCKNCEELQMLLTKSCRHRLFSENCLEARCHDEWLSKHWCPHCLKEREFEHHYDDWD